MNESSLASDFSHIAPGVHGHRTAGPHHVGPGHVGHSHVVQFYEDEVFLAHAAAQFVGSALENGQGGMVVATTEHLGHIDACLVARGVDVVDAVARDQYVAIDAVTLLAKLTVDGRLHPEQFLAVVGDMIARLAERCAPVRVFGEMAALLWARGNHDAVITLEQLWSELATRHAFSLCCAYPLAGFAGDVPDRYFHELCDTHTLVLPAESYLSLTTNDERLRRIACMQQKVTACAQREKQLFNLQDQAKGQYWLGVDGKILWANRAELDLFGYAYDQYVGRRLDEFCADRDVADGILYRLKRGETLYAHALNRRCRNGSVKRVLMYSGALWKWGELTYARCFTREPT